VCKKYFGSGAPHWGLDLLFPKLLGYPFRSIAIVDAAPVVHTRPPMSGELSYGVDIVGDTLSFLQNHGFPG
jgi:hypothetical protein